VTASAVRMVVIVVCGAGVAGMIATTIAGHNGAAMTFGITTAVAILCLMVATAVTTGPPRRGAGDVRGAVDVRGTGGAGDVEATASRVEDGVAALVAAGAQERAVRDLVRDAVSLGRQSARDHSC
jgi:hypothetical protein